MSCYKVERALPNVEGPVEQASPLSLEMAGSFVGLQASGAGRLTGFIHVSFGCCLVKYNKLLSIPRRRW